MSKRTKRKRNQNRVGGRVPNGRNGHEGKIALADLGAPLVEQRDREGQPGQRTAEVTVPWPTPMVSEGPGRRDGSDPSHRGLTLQNLGTPPEQPATVRVALGAELQNLSEGLPRFDPRAVIRCYVDGDHAGAIEACYQTLSGYATQTIDVLTPEIKHHVNTFIETVLFLFTRPDLVITREQTNRLLGAHHILTNLVAISVFKTTDPQLAIIGTQQSNFGKALLLYSARSGLYVDPREFFDADPQMASMWYATYGSCSVAPVSERVWNNLTRFLSYVDDRLQVPDHRICTLLFHATYIDDDRAREIKTRFNADIQRQIGVKGPKLVPERDRVAIISGKWRRGTAVHRSMSPLVNSLAGKYRLSLVCLGPPQDDVITDGFDEVLTIEQQGNEIDCTVLKESRFQLAFYPDVGMTAESIWLSNMRLAPIQAVGYGHPTTTAGSRIDYFIGGAEAEVPSRAQTFYSERLVLIPGLAAVPLYPTYTPRFPPLSADRLVVNLAWGAAKANYPMIKRLQAIKRRATRPVAYHFFPGWGLNRYHYVPVFLNELGELLGKDVTVFGNRGYTEYMEAQEPAHFALDSYPFGGYNTIIDSLYLGKPIVAQEGDRFYNRASSALLRRVGLDELIAHSEDEYIDKAVRLATDDGYREELTSRLRNTDLRACVFGDDQAHYFRKAIDYLIENHERLQREGNREPIWIH